MSKDKSSNRPTPAGVPEARQDRLAAALRSNLQKRKALSRAKAGRQVPADTPAPEPDDAER